MFVFYYIFATLGVVVLGKEQPIGRECDLKVTVNRKIVNDGFHREIHSRVEFVGGYGIIQRQHCFLALKENLPSGLYSNPDQLDDLARLGQVQACAGSVVDTEAPEPLSSNLSVIIYSNLQHNDNMLYASLTLPVHARYQAPSVDGGYRHITINNPDLYLRCAGHFNCPNIQTVLLPCYACSKEICTWTRVLYESETESLFMFVPLGDMQHYTMVTFFTFSITIGGAFYILSVLVNKYMCTSLS